MIQEIYSVPDRCSYKSNKMSAVTFISLVADAEHLVGVEALITRAGELSAAAGTIRTHAGAAVVSRAQDGVTIVAIQTPVEEIL